MVEGSANKDDKFLGTILVMYGTEDPSKALRGLRQPEVGVLARV